MIFAQALFYAIVRKKSGSLLRRMKTLAESTLIIKQFQRRLIGTTLDFKLSNITNYNEIKLLLLLIYYSFISITFSITGKLLVNYIIPTK